MFYTTEGFTESYIDERVDNLQTLGFENENTQKSPKQFSEE